MKTRQEIKDEVAQSYGYTSFSSFYDRYLDSKSGIKSITFIEIYDKAMEIYAQQKWEEACAKQANICMQIQEKGWEYKGPVMPPFNP